MRARCDKCGGWFTVEDCELVESELINDWYVDLGGNRAWKLTYRHGWQVAVDNFKYCGPIVVYTGEDDVDAD